MVSWVSLLASIWCKTCSSLLKACYLPVSMWRTRLVLAAVLASCAQAIYFTSPTPNTVWDSPKGKTISELYLR